MDNLKTAVGMIVLILIVGGYIANIAKLVGADTLQMVEIARSVGIVFPPLGVVLGFL